MATDYPELFAPLTINGLRLRNRAVAPPMYQARSVISDQGRAWYRRLAAGGAGLVIVEGLSVHRFAEELTATNLRPLADVIHREGAAAAVQLSLHPQRPGQDPTQMSPAELTAAIELFAKAGRVCREAGFDGAEPHGAHGFLLNQFFSPARNQRADAFGGNATKRGTMGVQIAKAIRTATGPAFLLLYRHTPKGDGYGLAESLDFARKLADVGVNVLDISPAKETDVCDLAAPFKACGVPVLAVNGMNAPVAACRALAAGRCDLVGLGRQLIADARWPMLVREGRIGEIVACRQCDEGCYGALRAGNPVVCVQWKSDELAAWL